jgi:hypothetical protein
MTIIEMAKRGKSSKATRRASKGLFRRIYSPIQHLIEASRNVSRSLFRRSGRIVNNGLGAVQNVGASVVKHANSTVKNIVSRKNRRSARRNETTRRNRK